MENNGIIYATLEGKKKLEKKLDEMIASRADIAVQIKVAREFGDLKENAEYAAAREAQNNLEMEIDEIEAMLPRIKTFSYAKADIKTVNVGTRVKLENVQKKNTVEYVITGILESDIDNGYLSNESPIGSALLGSKQGDEVEIKIPAGKIKYKIIKISNPV
jgi:transcription elongation factor GreA